MLLKKDFSKVGLKMRYFGAYSCEHILLLLSIAESLLLVSELLSGLLMIHGRVLEDLVLVDGGDPRPREDRLALTAVAVNGVDGYQHIYFI